MTKIEMDVEVEIERINDLLAAANISENRLNALAPIIENCAWMKLKLDATRKKIGSKAVVEKYENGEQVGIHESPLFRGYENLWKSYMAGMGRILDALPKETASALSAEVEKPKTVLEMVRGKHGKEA